MANTKTAEEQLKMFKQRTVSASPFKSLFHIPITSVQRDEILSNAKSNLSTFGERTIDSSKLLNNQKNSDCVIVVEVATSGKEWSQLDTKGNGYKPATSYGQVRYRLIGAPKVMTLLEEVDDIQDYIDMNDKSFTLLETEEAKGNIGYVVKDEATNVVKFVEQVKA